jgi:hypothetical protein
MRNQIEVTYWKIYLPQGTLPTEEKPDWEYVRSKVEGELPITLKVDFGKP